jgi:hypothetical protein
MRRLILSDDYEF